MNSLVDQFVTPGVDEPDQLRLTTLMSLSLSLCS